MQRKLLYSTTIFLVLFSCNLQNKIVLEGVGKGRMALSLELPSYMLDSIDLVAASIPGGEDLLKPEKHSEGPTP